MTVPIPFTYPTQTLGQTPEQPENLTHELSQQTLTYTKLTYTNVLEDLVEAEVNRQIKALPLEIRRFVRPIEVMTYALNRLQPLYACSEAGVKAQREKARALYGQEIAQVVTWGIRAVQKDPLRRFHPLKKAPAITPQELAALESIRSLLQDPSITKETTTFLPGSEKNPGVDPERFWLYGPTGSILGQSLLNRIPRPYRV